MSANSKVAFNHLVVTVSEHISGHFTDTRCSLVSSLIICIKRSVIHTVSLPCHHTILTPFKLVTILTPFKLVNTHILPSTLQCKGGIRPHATRGGTTTHHFFSMPTKQFMLIAVFFVVSSWYPSQFVNSSSLAHQHWHKGRPIISHKVLSNC